MQGEGTEESTIPVGEAWVEGLNIGSNRGTGCWRWE